LSKWDIKKKTKEAGKVECLRWLLPGPGGVDPMLCLWMADKTAANR
jgi:hypothetical protein